MKKTKAALMARGIDSRKAELLIAEGYKLGDLKQAADARLHQLGLTDLEIKKIRRGSRPPIPSHVITKLLFDNRYQCCVCRDPSKPLIVHHIVDWSESHSHDPSNLAVLCLDHHNSAHSRSTLSQNLDRESLRDFKNRWERDVKILDSRSFAESMKAEYAHYAYINELRLFELSEEHKIDRKTIAYFIQAKRDNVIDRFGNPLPVRADTYYKYAGSAILTRYAFMKSLLVETIKHILIINLSDYLDKSVVAPAILPGDFIATQGSHTFSPLPGAAKKGIGQSCQGIRRANGVEIKFTFDRWEATSSSSKNDWLVGTKSATSLIQVRDVRRDDGKVVVSGTVLAIASFAEGLKSREYANTWLNWMPRRHRASSD